MSNPAAERKHRRADPAVTLDLGRELQRGVALRDALDTLWVPKIQP